MASRDPQLGKVKGRSHRTSAPGCLECFVSLLMSTEDTAPNLSNICSFPETLCSDGYHWECGNNRTASFHDVFTCSPSTNGSVFAAGIGSSNLLFGLPTSQRAHTVQQQGLAGCSSVAQCIHRKQADSEGQCRR